MLLDKKWMIFGHLLTSLLSTLLCFLNSCLWETRRHSKTLAWFCRNSSFPSCWQCWSMCSCSSAFCTRSPISRHFWEYCSESTCSSRFRDSTSDLQQRAESCHHGGPLSRPLRKRGPSPTTLFHSKSSMVKHL